MELTVIICIAIAGHCAKSKPKGHGKLENVMEKVMEFEELKRVRILIHPGEAEKSKYQLRNQIVHTW